MGLGPHVIACDLYSWTPTQRGARQVRRQQVGVQVGPRQQAGVAQEADVALKGALAGGADQPDNEKKGSQCFGVTYRQLAQCMGELACLIAQEFWNGYTLPMQEQHDEGKQVVSMEGIRLYAVASQ